MTITDTPTITDLPPDQPLAPILRLSRDIRAAGAELNRDSARYLVDTYYQIQHQRITTNNQIRQQENEPHLLLTHLADQFTLLENQTRSALGVWAKSTFEGQWALDQHGIGPVIAAGLVAHIDWEFAQTAGAVWSFCGVDPSKKWEKGQKRPYSASAKQLVFKISDSFVKSSGSDKSFYGPLYRQKKEQIIARNEAGGFSDLAARTLESHPKHAQAAIYKEGKIPDGRVDNQARRWAAKLFLSHMHEVSWSQRGGAPRPWVIEHGGHVHYMPPPPGGEYQP